MAVVTAQSASRHSGEHSIVRLSSKLKEHETIMHPNHILSDGNQLIEKVCKKWIDLSNGIVRAIAKEFLHIRREEMKEQLGAYNQRE